LEPIGHGGTNSLRHAGPDSIKKQLLQLPSLFKLPHWQSGAEAPVLKEWFFIASIQAAEQNFSTILGYP
jgi:hypothetical protein